MSLIEGINNDGFFPNNMSSQKDPKKADINANKLEKQLEQIGEMTLEELTWEKVELQEKALALKTKIERIDASGKIDGAPESASSAAEAVNGKASVQLKNTNVKLKAVNEQIQWLYDRGELTDEQFAYLNNITRRLEMEAVYLSIVLNSREINGVNNNNSGPNVREARDAAVRNLGMLILNVAMRQQGLKVLGSDKNFSAQLQDQNAKDIDFAQFMPKEDINQEGVVDGLKESMDEQSAVQNMVAQSFLTQIGVSDQDLQRIEIEEITAQYQGERAALKENYETEFARFEEAYAVASAELRNSFPNVAMLQPVSGTVQQVDPVGIIQQIEPVDAIYLSADRVQQVDPVDTILLTVSTIQNTGNLIYAEKLSALDQQYNEDLAALEQRYHVDLEAVNMDEASVVLALSVSVNKVVQQIRDLEKELQCVRDSLLEIKGSSRGMEALWGGGTVEENPYQNIDWESILSIDAAKTIINSHFINTSNVITFLVAR